MSRKGISYEMSLNLGTNFLALLLNILLGLVVVPFYISKIGVDGYGLIALATSFSSYLSIITIAIDAAVGRNFTLAMRKEDHQSSSAIYSSSIIAASVLILGLLPLIGYFLYRIDDFISYQGYTVPEIRWVFLSIITSFILTFIRGLFLVPAFASNKIYIQRIIAILDIVVRTALIFLLLNASVQLGMIGWAFFAASLLSFVVALVWIWRKFPFLKLKAAHYDKSIVQYVASMSFWLIINQIGTLLFINIDIILLNYYYGATATGEFSTVAQWHTLLRAFAGVFVAIFTPVVYKYYADNDFSNLLKFSRYTVVAMGVVLAIPIGIIVGYADIILRLWVGEQFVRFYPLMILLTGHLIFNLSVLPILSINSVYNKVKIPGITSFLCGILNLVLGVLIIRFFDLGIYSVAIASAVLLTLKNLVFSPTYAARILNQSNWFYYPSILRGCALFVWVLLVSWCCRHLQTPGSWAGLFVSAVIIGGCSIPFAWFVTLNKEQRVLIGKIIRRR
ncbi:oligosaccharide flippase family protein [Chitinophaga nivalis]|uniref:Oligosaccharide flippase family protein n=1 Tax=Chitinophaga nivalis TaxID=2991709 RepID=A0ABT3INX9_9BACT|nr:oligosaccharide flippase family protein [Chitinophaga nivalis]MCW3464661.1 oligosaccharide flippase family protein [Chitinophaga nivalis]MCW3485648.1 oligosaccharide flippase family protein [Chitinophaga nivalis]